jgi:two-component system, chemotaxis family, response regulator Rcp1
MTGGTRISSRRHSSLVRVFFGVVQAVLLSVKDNDADYYLINLAVRETCIAIRLCRVSDGESAVRFLHRSHGYEVAPRPDLILLDLNLPKRGGLEVLCNIQASVGLRSIPVIVFTSSTLEADRQRALALGAEEYISKPQSLEELFQVVSSVCGRLCHYGH